MPYLNIATFLLYAIVAWSNIRNKEMSHSKILKKKGSKTDNKIKVQQPHKSNIQEN